MYDFIIVGSGMASIGSALAISGKNKKIAILDFGKNINKPIKDKINEVLEKDFNLEKINSIESIKNLSNIKNYGQKTFFGSKHMYNIMHSNKDMFITSSYAAGGFSSIWGASIIPYTKEQIESWKINFVDMEASYNFLYKKFSNYTHNYEDDFKYYYNLQNDGYKKFIKSKIKNIFLECQKNKKKINENNFIFGMSRLMVDTKCNGCGLCMYGCPYGYIFNSSDQLKEIIKNGTQYIKVKVEKFEELENEIIVYCLDYKDNKKIQFKCKKLIIGAGAFGTADIVFNSTNKIKKCNFLESQFFNFPIFTKYKNSDERSFTLSDFFLNYINNNNLSESFMQMYAMNDYFSHAINQKLKIPGFLHKFFKDFFLKKILICNGYIHSNFSDSVLMESDGNNRKFSLLKNEIKNKLIKSTIKKVEFIGKYMGLKTSSIFSITHPFGSSFHVGGSFPMNAKNNINGTNNLGKLQMFNNVHIVDSSIFPNIPPNTISFTEMANAHRISTMLL